MNIRIVLAVPALILWDVDHTLVENAGVSKEIYAAAFESLAGFPARIPAVTEGRTDRTIMPEMLEAHGVAVPSWEVVAKALEAAGEQRYDAMRARGHALPGVVEALQAISSLPGFVQSLLTGNVLSNARVKVSALGLADAFDFNVGGYGSDSHDRADLVAVAQRRASKAYRAAFSRMNTVLIGDTPRDVDAGARGGAHVIAVASGSYSVDELRAAGDAIVLAHLVDTEGLLDKIKRMTS